MHVLFLHSYYCTDVSTSGSRSHDLCKALSAKGHRVTVVCQVVDLNRSMFEDMPGFIKELVVDGVRVYGIAIPYSNRMGVLRRLFSFFLFMFAACAKCASIGKADVVFATSTPPTIAVPALFVKLTRRVPFVFELRDIWPDFVEQLNVLPMVPAWFFRLIDRCMIKIYRLADFVTTTTPGMTEIIARKGIPRSKLGTILLGAKRNLYAVPHVPHALLSLPLFKGRFIVAFLGSISHGYGLTRLLDVAAETARVNPNISFLILGRGGHFQLIADRISAMSLTNVHLGAAIAYHEVPSVLKNVHVGYESSIPSPASDCGLDNKFYDYISAGLPILSNYDGDMGNLLRQYNCGFVASSVAEEVDFLDRLEKSRETHRLMSRNSLRLAEELDREKQKDLFVALLERAVKGKSE